MKRLLLILVTLVVTPLATLAGLVACVAIRAPVPPTVHAPRVSQPLDAAYDALRRDDPLLAIAYCEQVGPRERGYPRAQRMIGYDIYAVALGRPAEGIRHALRSLRSDPGSENAWTDAARVMWLAVSE